MAIAFDAFTNDGIDNPVTQKLFNHTTGSGDNRIMFITIITGASSVSSVYYNSVEATQIGRNDDGATYVYLYYLVAPATGTNEVEINIPSSTFIIAHAATYTGASQTGVPDASDNTDTTTGTSFTTDVTSVAEDCWIIAAVRDSTGSNDYTAGANTTLRNIDDGFGAWTMDSNAARASGSNSLGISVNTGSRNWASVIASFAPSGATSTFTPKIMMCT